MTPARNPTRPTILCSNGIVATGHQLASQAALRTLLQGGNAVDAAVTAAATLGVVQPDASGVGADVFMLVYSAAQGRAFSVSGNGRSPAAMSEDILARHRRRADGEAAEVASPPALLKGPLAATVPGAIRAWSDALERFGTIDLGAALQPAIGYADGGFPVSPRLARLLRRNRELLRRFPATAATYLRDGEPYAPGARLRLPELAASLRLLAADGAAALHGGALGRRIADAQAAEAGVMAEADLAEHASSIGDPISVRYRDHEVAVQPPVSMGAVLLEELKIVEGFDLAALPLESTERIHLLVEAKKLAFADMDTHLADPDFTDASVAQLLTEAHAAGRRATINQEAASQGSGDPPAYGDHTTYLAVADREGNVVSFIQSLFHQFGSGWVVPGTGILLNDRMNGFSRDPGHINRVDGRKLTAHTLNAPMAFVAGRPVLAIGTPGGYGQVQSNLQMLTAFVDDRLEVQDLVERPRWRSEAGRELAIESRFPDATLRGLERLGHELTIKGDWSSAMGDAQAVRVNQEAGCFEGASDPRREGYVVGW